MEKSAEKFLRENEMLLLAARKRSGINFEKVQMVVSEYLTIARNNHLNYNELLQVLEKTRGTVTQSLNMLSISTLPETISDEAIV